MPRVALVDWNWLGHVALFTRSIAKVFAAAGWQVEHFCRHGDLASQSFAEAQLPVQCHDLKSYGPAGHRRWPLQRRSTLAARARWNALATAFTQQHAESFDFVFFPWIDEWLDRGLSPAVLPVTMPPRFGALLLNAGHFSSPSPNLRRHRRQSGKFRLLASPKLSLLSTLDELAIDALGKRFSHATVAAMPDFIEAEARFAEPSEAMRQAQHGGRPILLSVGLMQRRKGHLKLLELAKQNRLGAWQVVLSGRIVWDHFAPSEQDLLRTAINGQLPGVMIQDGHLPTESHLNAEIQAADAIFLGYERWKQSSNIMTRAAQCSRPVISCPEGLLAHRTKTHRLGWVLENESPDAIEKMLKELTADRLDHQSANNDYAGFTQLHDISRLSETFASVLTQPALAKAA
ncbi:MAG: hypothetical protein AAF958_04625 [Planctomycetota bacterium]